MELPRGYISYNQIKLYRQCPRAYYCKYIQGLEDTLDDKIYLGIVFHSSVENHLKKRIAGLFCTAKEAMEDFSRIFEEQQAFHPVQWKNPKRDVERRGQAMLAHYLKEMDKEVDPLLVEEEMEELIPEIGIRLRGIVDLIEKDFSISDFKTATARWSGERAESSFLQMVIYRYLFERRYGPVTTRLRFRVIYSRSARTVRQQVLSFPASDADFSKMIQVISAVADGIRSEAFHPISSYRCRNCGFRAECPGVKAGA